MMETVYLESEVAELLRVRLKVIQRERYAGRLGYVRVGNQVRIRQSDLDAYLSGQSACRESPKAPTLPGGITARAPTTSSFPTAEAVSSAIRRARRITARLSKHSASS